MRHVRRANVIKLNRQSNHADFCKGGAVESYSRSRLSVPDSSERLASFIKVWVSSRSQAGLLGSRLPRLPNP
jgi:hypothetical protein